jgi:hypothetical protein
MANLFDLCRRWDSNPQGLPHTSLSRTRIPVPPRRLLWNVISERDVYIPIFSQIALICQQGNNFV